MNIQDFKNGLLLFLLGCITFYTQAQEPKPIFLETQAIITSLESGISGRTSRVTATVSYLTESGDSLKSQIRLFNIPIIGSFKDVGDTITVLYQKDNPYLVKANEESFWQTYGLYVLIALGIVVTGYRLMKVKKTR